MKLDLCSTTDNDNVLGKTLKVIKTIDITLRKSDNINDLTITINRYNYDPETNYAKIDLLGIMYFVTTIDETNNHYITLQLTEDVLETHKNVILASRATITGKAEPSYLQAGLPLDSRIEKDIFKSDKTLDKANSFIAITIGG